MENLGPVYVGKKKKMKKKRGSDWKYMKNIKYAERAND